MHIGFLGRDTSVIHSLATPKTVKRAYPSGQYHTLYRLNAAFEDMNAVARLSYARKEKQTTGKSQPVTLRRLGKEPRTNNVLAFSRG
jgi:hypothetical protein